MRSGTSLSALAAVALGFLLALAHGSSITASSRLNLEEELKLSEQKEQAKPNSKQLPGDLKKTLSGSFHSRKIKSKTLPRHPKAWGSGSPPVPPVYKTPSSPPPPPPPHPVYEPNTSLAPSPAPSQSPSTGNADQQAFLDPHYAARAKKSLPPLSWDPVLEEYARQWGNHQRDTDNCKLVHSHGQYGENLFWGYGARYAAGDAVGFWTDEEKYYDYATNSCASGQMCGHYTQVVWKSTTHLGCATISCKDSSIFIICSYNPPGNYIGKRPY